MLDCAIETIVRVLQNNAAAVPVSKFRPFTKPYWNSTLSHLKVTKVEKYKLWKDSGKPRGSDPLYREHLTAKKNFSKELRKVAKSYERQELNDAVNSVGSDKTVFWRLLKRSRSTPGHKSLAVRNSRKTVVHKLEDVLEAWREHFANLCTPKGDKNFDEDHYNHVTESVRTYDSEVDTGTFLESPFDENEIKSAIDKLHMKKASGFDGISNEQIRYAGQSLVRCITLIFNMMCKIEYIPINMRRGVQIPLFKGKNLCSLDQNNYRGITLLSGFNKIFEMVIWARLKKWWDDNDMISRLQGACRKGQSCIHTGYLLQETVSTALENNRNVFVSFFDVSKAFDTVWTDGLFFQLYQKGVRGRLWRMMYRTYQDFQCQVRIGGGFSNWYSMSCGIHQGGFLSLTKYITFINDLLCQLEESNLCCSIYKVPSSPAGYADDLATATISKTRTDRVHGIVYEFANRWRFKFNARKSAVLVHGESKRESTQNAKDRVFKLGAERVLEKVEYEHLGVKTCIHDDNDSRIEDKISKGRKTLNAASGLGFRRDGLTMTSCNLIYWAVVVPIVSFGCELWTLSERDSENLMSFQRYAGRRVQRFPKRSPSTTSSYGLGWIRLTTYILIKKLLFILTILKMDQTNLIRKVFGLRIDAYFTNVELGRSNPYKSPTFEALNACNKLGLLDVVRSMTNGSSILYGKKKWSDLVWERAWKLDDAFWKSINPLNPECDLVSKVLGCSRYMFWWSHSDDHPEDMKMCETMARIICRTSLLKSDDTRLIGGFSSNRTCTKCDLYILEDIRHLVMQCPAVNEIRLRMYRKINEVYSDFEEVCREQPEDVLGWLLGGQCNEVEYEVMSDIWKVAGNCITEMYYWTVRGRTGVG